ncbi:MAG TPA: DUF523 domain-containing protein [Planctomycetota bacterium]
MPWMKVGPRPRVGISACLLGQNVRYDGGHKRDPFLVDVLGKSVTYVPVCPEVEVGMGTPREPIRLERSGKGIRLVGVESGVDHTEAMVRFADRRAAALEALYLAGYIFKKDSPSCGVERVRVFRRNGAASRTGRGLFAQRLMAHLPLLPVEDEGRLGDPRVRENFLARVLAYRRVTAFFRGRWTPKGLARFHAAEGARSRALDRIVARSNSRPRAETAARYLKRTMAALAKAIVVVWPAR